MSNGIIDTGLGVVVHNLWMYPCYNMPLLQLVNEMTDERKAILECDAMDVLMKRNHVRCYNQYTILYDDFTSSSKLRATHRIIETFYKIESETKNLW